MFTSELDYVLPPERIAQEPLAVRDASRLLVLHRASGRTEHRAFGDLPSLLAPGDLLVLNDTRVVPVRLYGFREQTGGRVEVLFLQDLGARRHLALTRSGGTLKVGERLSLADGRLRVRLIERRGESGDLVEVESPDPLGALLHEVGHMPVPPYIRRDPGAGPSALDRERYQTVYARNPGAVAAPTAGLHFTERVFAGLEARGIQRTHVTLRVGPGTFRPIKSERVEDHTMEAEHYEVPREAARAIESCRTRNGRVVAVGTTTVRTLESAVAPDGSVRHGEGTATLFIVPGYAFGVVNVLLTNFHLPKGTPLALTAAFAGREAVLAAYQVALRAGYRFLSYGDAMLIL